MTRKNHPLESILDIEEGSTPIDNPFVVAENESKVLDQSDLDELEEDSDDDFYEIDNSVENAMARAPKLEEFYDDIDKKNERKFQEVYDYAQQAFSQQIQEASLVEGRFRARNLEVAAQYLRIALDSAKDSGNQKANKDKLKLAEKKVIADANNKTTNNNIIVNHSSLLRALAKAEADDPKVINPEVKD